MGFRRFGAEVLVRLWVAARVWLRGPVVDAVWVDESGGSGLWKPLPWILVR